MNKEIERKFLVNRKIDFLGHFWLIRQGYINFDNDKNIRIRLECGKAMLCIKYFGSDPFSRDEYEYEIPLSDGIELYSDCRYKLEKKRAIVNIESPYKWIIDEYPNDLIVCEIEFDSLVGAMTFEAPDFLGKEVTGIKKYSNIELSKQNLRFK